MASDLMSSNRVDQMVQNGLLAFKVVIDERLVDAGVPGDVVHARGVEAPVGKMTFGDVEDPVFVPRLSLVKALDSS
jgi:hypothetical protein